MATIWQNIGEEIWEVTKNVHSSIVNISNEVGRGALHAVAPDDFEYYLCAFELVDSMYNSVGYLIFPVMPNNLNETKTSIKTVTKTHSGIVTLFNSSFNPRDISIQGTFGRKFRLLLGCKDVPPVYASSAGYDFGIERTVNPDPNPLIKTGYGVTKIMKNIIDMSDSVDNDNRPYFLVFHNYAFNTHYVVEVLQSSFSQSVENNMLWFYNVEMKAIAPADALLNKENIGDFLLGGVKNKAVANVTQRVVESVLRKIAL